MAPQIQGSLLLFSTLINICDQLHKTPTCARSVNGPGPASQRRSPATTKNAAGSLPPRRNSYLAGPGAETPVAKPSKKAQRAIPAR
jgi:hypothetical protein